MEVLNFRWASRSIYNRTNYAVAKLPHFKKTSVHHRTNTLTHPYQPGVCGTLDDGNRLAKKKAKRNGKASRTNPPTPTDAHTYQSTTRRKSGTKTKQRKRNALL